MLRIRRTLAGLLCIGLLSPALAGDTLTLGLFAYRPKDILEKRYRPLAEHLGQALGDTRIELRILDQDEIAEALQQGRLDLIFTNPAHYVQLRTRFNLTGALATLVSKDSGLPTSQLGGVIVARADTDRPRAIADLRGRTIAIPGSRYLGGYQTQAYELLQAGLKLPGDARLQIEGSHDAVIAAVLDGRADAGFVRTGLIEQMTREGTLDPARLRLIAPRQHPDFPYLVSTRLYPEWAFVALPHVDNRQVRIIASTLMLLDAGHPAALSAGIAGFVPPADYLPVEQIMRELRAPPFDRAPEITLDDIWTQHRPTVVVGLFALLVVGLLAALLANRNRALLRGNEAVNRERQRLNEVLAATGEGIWEWDIDSGRLTCNPRWGEILGLPDDSTASRREQLIDRMRPEDRPEVQKRLQACLEGSARYRAEFRLRRDDGSEIWVHEQGDVVARDGFGRPQRMVGSLADIGERKQLELELGRRMRELTAILENSSVGIVLVQRRQLVWMNGRLAEILDCPADTLNGVAAERLFHTPEDYRQVDDESMAALSRGQRVVMESKLRRRDGAPVWVRLYGKAIDAGRLPAGVIWVIEDITQQRLAHEELREASRLAEAANRAKSEFLANMSHEIRTPMNAVLGLAQLLEQETLSPGQREMVARIRTAGRSLLQILNDILDFSKIEAGRLQIDRHAFALGSLLGQIDFIFGNLARGKGLAWRIEGAGDVPGALLGDSLRLEQTLSNLIANAIKFTREGGVAVRVRLLAADTSAVRLRFEVADTGIGIAPTVLPGLFRPFTQADGSTTRRFGGTGLGLVICRRLVELMGGTLGVDSTPGQGSTFWFELPFARAGAGALPAPAAGGDAAPRPRRLDGLRVLLVDDSPENRLIAERMLQREGAGVMLAGNGREALDLLAAHPDGFDLALMDMQMPVMDGFAATRAIRAGSVRPDLPVVAYTAGVLREEREAMIAAGVDDILSKPVDLERMVTLLSRWHAAPPTPDGTPGTPAASSADAPLPPDRLHARLVELDHMLANGMLAARETMREIEAGVAGTPHAERLHPVAEAVRKLAFAEARQHLGRILAETAAAG